MNNDELKAEIEDNSRVINLAINLIEEINEAREKNNMNTTEETDERTELALSNVRSAMELLENNENVLKVYAQLASAEHHLTREV